MPIAAKRLTIVVRPFGNGRVVEGVDQDLLIGIQHRRESGIGALSLDMAVAVSKSQISLTRLDTNCPEQDKNGLDHHDVYDRDEAPEWMKNEK